MLFLCLTFKPGHFQNGSSGHGFRFSERWLQFQLFDGRSGDGQQRRIAPSHFPHRQRVESEPQFESAKFEFEKRSVFEKPTWFVLRIRLQLFHFRRQLLHFREQLLYFRFVVSTSAAKFFHGFRLRDSNPRLWSAISDPTVDRWACFRKIQGKTVFFKTFTYLQIRNTKQVFSWFYIFKKMLIVMCDRFGFAVWRIQYFHISTTR